MARGSVNSINVKISRAKVGWAKAGPSNVVDSLCVVEKFEKINFVDFSICVCIRLKFDLEKAFIASNSATSK